MAGVQVPPELNPIKVYLIRSLEVKDRNPVVSYWTKFYAIQLGLSVKAESCKSFLKQLLGELESSKKALKDVDGVSDQTLGQVMVENFAFDLFTKADDEDFAGRTSANTGKTFVAACHFFDVLNVFGSEAVTAEIASKMRYCKWRAAIILRAVKEGSAIPPPVKDQGDCADPVEESNDLSTGSLSGQLASAPQAVLPQVETRQEDLRKTSRPSAPASNPIILQTPVVVNAKQGTGSTNGSSLIYDPAVLQAAQKQARFCISALQYDDVKTAINNLEQALKLLEPYRNR